AVPAHDWHGHAGSQVRRLLAVAHRGGAGGYCIDIDLTRRLGIALAEKTRSMPARHQHVHELLLAEEVQIELGERRDHFRLEMVVVLRGEMRFPETLESVPRSVSGNVEEW